MKRLKAAALRLCTCLADCHSLATSLCYDWGCVSEDMGVVMQGLLGSEIVGANEEFVHINGRLHNSQAASFMTRTGLQVISPCCMLN